MPDVSGSDGADAVSTIEAEGLTATLSDAEDDPLFDSQRDASGCEVHDQDPVAGAILEEGGEVTITVSCAHVDWENREGSAWEAFSESYGSGFDEGCQALFDQPPDGSLYEDDYEYTAVDCQNENSGDGSEASDIPSDVPDDPESAGTEIGELDGCTALFQNQSVYSLNHGEESWTEADCPIGGDVASRTDGGGGDGTGSSSPMAGEPRAKRAGAMCAAKRADGTPIVIEIDSGQVNCRGAEALWNEYMRRAQNEGMGSGAALELEGWSCIAASAAQAPKAGGCSAADGSGAFNVSDGE